MHNAHCCFLFCLFYLLICYQTGAEFTSQCLTLACLLMKMIASSNLLILVWFSFASFHFYAFSKIKITLWLVWLRISAHTLSSFMSFGSVIMLGLVCIRLKTEQDSLFGHVVLSCFKSGGKIQWKTVNLSCFSYILTSHPITSPLHTVFLISRALVAL